MANTLHFNDGTHKEVPYNVAAKVYQALLGNKDPENDTISAYCDRTMRVEFEELPKPKKVVRRDITQPDPELHRLMNDPNLHGYSRFQAIGKHIQGRVQ